MILVFVVAYFACMTIFLFVVKGVYLSDGVIMISMFMKIYFVIATFITRIQNFIIVFPAYDVEFTSRYEPHEIYSSPLLPREDLLKCLRRTAVTFRLVNHEGWANREFIHEQKRLLNGARKNTEIHDAFFYKRDQLGISNVALIDLMVEGLKKDLKPNSNFVKEDFPYAETWWWANSKYEVSNSWILKFLSECN